MWKFKRYPVDYEKFRKGGNRGIKNGDIDRRTKRTLRLIQFFNYFYWKIKLPR
jgi:hypothetical protein